MIRVKVREETVMRETFRMDEESKGFIRVKDFGRRLANQASTLISLISIVYNPECDIHENFDTNECPNIFISTKLHE